MLTIRTLNRRQRLARGGSRLTELEAALVDDLDSDWLDRRHRVDVEHARVLAGAAPWPIA